jgi:hypothetical protein
MRRAALIVLIAGSVLAWAVIGAVAYVAVATL